jgi:hypothetical protein
MSGIESEHIPGQVLALILDRIDSGFRGVEKRFDVMEERQDTRYEQLRSTLDDHGERIGRLEIGGCGRYEEHQALLDRLDGGGAPRFARTKQIALPAGLGGVIVAMLYELAKHWK